MARGVNIDPNFAQEQSRYFNMKALAMAKNTGATTGKKASFIIDTSTLKTADLSLSFQYSSSPHFLALQPWVFSQRGFMSVTTE